MWRPDLRSGLADGAGWSEDVDGVEPGFGEGGPVGDGEVGGAEAEAVAAKGEEVEFGGDFGVFEGLEVDEGVFYVGGVVVLGLDEEGGRGRGVGWRMGSTLPPSPWEMEPVSQPG